MGQDKNLAWDDLHLIRTVAVTGSLAAASDALGVNHSTVFRKLGLIEAQLGTRLFERHRSGYVPTPTGEAFAQLGDSVETQLSALMLKLSGQQIAPRGELRITTNETLLVYLLTPILAAFRERHPEITLDIILSTEALNLAKRDADVAIRATDSPPDNLVGRRLATLGWAIYGQAQAWREKAWTQDAMAEADWVTLGDRLAHLAVSKWVRSRIPAERLVYKVNTVLGLAEAIEAGIGVGPVPCFIADMREGLTRLAPPAPDFSAGLWALTHPDLRHSPRVRVFLDFLAVEITREKARLAGD